MNPAFLFISKDLGGADVAIPLARLAQVQGYNVAVIAEDLAAREFEHAGFSLYYDGGVYESGGQVSAADAQRMLGEIKPDVVIATCGNPINLEATFAQAANALGIPLVLLEDFWGGSCHVDAAPQLVLTLDEIGQHIIQRHRPDTPTAIVGNHAVKDPRSITMSDKLQERMVELRKQFERIILFVGGGPSYTGASIELLKASLQKTDLPWMLIPRFHPKWIDAMYDIASRTSYGTMWNEQLSDLGGRVVRFDDEDIVSLVMASDIVFSPFSTTLATAVSLGKKAVSISTPESRKDMRMQMTIEHHPLIETGLVSEISDPTNLAPSITGPSPAKELTAENLRDYKAETALDAIVMFFDKTR